MRTTGPRLVSCVVIASALCRDSSIHGSEARFGAEAAEGLAELDRERERWRERVDSYRMERDAIASDSTLTAEQKSARMRTHGK